MRVGVVRVETERLPVAGLRLGEAAEVVIDVAEIEVRFEEVGLEADRALVQRLRFGELVAAVVDVREVDERRDEIGIELERLSIGGRRLFERRFVAIVQRRRRAEIVLGQRRIARADRLRLERTGAPAAGAGDAAA